MCAMRRLLLFLAIAVVSGYVGPAPSAASPASTGFGRDADQDRPDLMAQISDLWTAVCGALRWDAPGPSALPGRIFTPASRATCLRAADGAIDCEPAVRGACAREGFGTGIALDQATSEVCRGNPMAAISSTTGRDCRRKTWVTRVACW